VPHLRVIEIATVGNAIKLAKAFKERAEIPVGRDRVMRRFAVSLQEKRITTEKVTSGLWKKLIDEGYLQIIAERPDGLDSGGAPAAPAEGETLIREKPAPSLGD
jgi:hypothetical protein